MPKKFLPIILAALLCVSPFVPLLGENIAYAATAIVIDTENTSSFFQYNNGSGWSDLLTPKHFIRDTGAVTYCLQHTKGNPFYGTGRTHSDEENISDHYDAVTLYGLFVILERGYPWEKPEGFSNDQARYATANAIRAWLSERNDPFQYAHMNRITNPGSVRAKSGQEATLAWMDQLVGYARSMSAIQRSVTFSPTSLNMTVSGGYYTGSATVNLVNCSGGYTLDTSSLPSGATVTGYTGRTGDTLTIKIPLAHANARFTITATGIDNRTPANVHFYKSNNENIQNLIAYGDGTMHPTTSRGLNMDTPGYGKIQVTKTDGETSGTISVAVFGIYSNAQCTTEVARITTNGSGIAISGDLPIGSTYYLKEISVPSPYVLDGTVHTIALNTTATINRNITNRQAKGRIEITKTNSNPALGNYSQAGAQFGIYDGDTLVDTITIQADGKGTSMDLPINRTYTIRELQAAPNMILSSEEKTVTLPYENMNTAVVMGRTDFENHPFVGRVAIEKADAGTGEALPGAVFHILSKDGKTIVEVLETNDDGKARSGMLPIADYLLREVSPSPGYILSDEVTPFSVTPSGEALLIFKRENAPNEVVLSKTDITDGKPVPGATIIITDEDGEVVFDGDTDEDGEIVLDRLPAGEYEFYEEVSPDGYARNTTVFIFSIDEYGIVTGTTDITDEPITLILEKRDAHTQESMGGVIFSLVDSAGETVKLLKTENSYYVPDAEGKTIFITDAQGQAEIRYLPQGDYTIEEKTPYGYVAHADISVTLTDFDGLSSPKIIEVFNEPTGLILQKTDGETGDIVTGAGFTFKQRRGPFMEILTFTKNKDGSYTADPEGEIEEIFVDESGKIEITNLPVNIDLWAQESTTPEGYFPSAATPFRLTDENTVETPHILEIVNYPAVKLGLDYDKYERPMIGVVVALSICFIGWFCWRVVRKRKAGKERQTA